MDRLFLTWYSAGGAGAVTGLFVTWSVVGLCIGIGEYLTTFVAQYYGARASAYRRRDLAGRLLLALAGAHRP